ncbi:MAG: hypothetical protein BAJALOKI1v1_370021 [Promethearchaeota archaeon]|nr:MAG: hypothetical protein BAJALOKI1v1_370021 [Candidatus Lokiarchaeota archaeon]
MGKRLDLIHFESERVENAGLPAFNPVEPNCIEIRDTSTIITPDCTTEIKTRVLQTIVRLTPFLNKMYPILESEGVQLPKIWTSLDVLFNDL